MTTTRKPIRVRKARHSSTCPSCRRLILTGERIISDNGTPWRCLNCHMQATRHQPQEEKQQ